MFDYVMSISADCASERARMRNKKVITTDRQWIENARGSASPTEYNLSDLFDKAWAQIRQDTDYYGENYRSLYDY